MTTLIPTLDKGATVKPTEAIYTPPDAAVTDQMLAEQLALDGVNAPFVADLLSAMLAHERCGVHLYRSVAGRTNNEVLRSNYEEFGAETLEHVEILEQLISGSGGNPSYVSAMTRAVEAADARILESTFMLNGSVDPMTAEMTMLDAVFLAEAKDQANWATMASLAGLLPDGPFKEAASVAVEQVKSQEDEHLLWARDTAAQLITIQAMGPEVPKTGATADELLDEVRSWLT